MSMSKKRKFSISDEQEINDGIAEINRNMMFNKLANEYYKGINTEYEIKSLKTQYNESLLEINILKEGFKKQHIELFNLKRLVKKLVKKYDTLYDNDKSKKDLDYQEIKDLFNELYIEKKFNEEICENRNIDKGMDVKSENEDKYSSLYIS